MDTILIAKETIDSLQQLIPDSVLLTSGKGLHVIFPDSIQTFQRTEPDFLFTLNKKDFISLSGVIISICALGVTVVNNLGNKRKEKARIDKVKAHVLGYLKIIKSQLIDQIRRFYHPDDDYSHPNGWINENNSPESVYIPFDKILEINNIDLSEALVFKLHKRRFNKLQEEDVRIGNNLFKLNQITILRDDTNKVVRDGISKLKTQSIKCRGDLNNLKTAFNDMIEYRKYSHQFKLEAENEINNLFDKAFSVNDKIETLNQGIKLIKRSINQFNDKDLKNASLNNLITYYNNIILHSEELIKSIKAYVELLSNLSKQFHLIWKKIKLIESNYLGKITNHDFYFSYKDLKIDDNEARMMIIDHQTI